MTDDVLETMAKYENICEYIHLPVQSGNNRILEMMNRGYTREWYLDRIAAIKKYLPECGISTDVITGFCSETDAEHQETVQLMHEVEYDFAYMFKYSERPKTLAERKYSDDVPEEVKTARLTEIINIQQDKSLKRNRLHVGKNQKVLIEGNSKRSDSQYMGRNSQNAVVIFDKGDYAPGDYVMVKINDCTAATLFGDAIEVVNKRNL
jgi:tRNA-2-methylthio-N6-dimethylallyladenosine synthase